MNPDSTPPARPNEDGSNRINREELGDDHPLVSLGDELVEAAKRVLEEKGLGKDQADPTTPPVPDQPDGEQKETDD